MSFLFKTILKQVSKNKVIVLTLGFFVSSGVTVLSSVDNLSDNLNKGFKEVNFDSNPHDLVLVSKSFKQTENLDIDPSYVTPLESISFTPHEGYRWSFDSNRDHSYVKKSDENKVSTKDTSSTSSNKKLVALEKSILSIPPAEAGHESKSGANSVLICYSPDTFVLSIDKELSFLDRNKASLEFDKLEEDTWDYSRFFTKEFMNEKNILEQCRGERGVKRGIWLFTQYFYYLIDYFRETISQEKTNSETPTSKSSSSSKDEGKLSEEELAEFHSGAFNRKWIFRSKVGSDTQSVYSYRPFIEKDYYFKFSLPFQNMLSGRDISKQYKKLISEIKNSSIFFKLDEGTKQSIEIFDSSKIFEKIDGRFYVSSLIDVITPFNMWIPMLPGMTYESTLIFLFKAAIWQYLQSNTDSPKKFSELFSEGSEGELKQKFNNDDTSSSNSIGIDNWDPFGKLVGGSDEETKTFDDYVFSVLRSNKKLSDLKSASNSEEYKEFKSDNVEEDNGIKYNDLCGDNGGRSKRNAGGTTTCKNLQEESDATLMKQWKKIMKAWMNGDYYKGTPNGKNDKLLIPSFSKFSAASFSAKGSSKSADKPFKKAENSFPYYRPWPDSFDDVYKKIGESIKKSIGDYLVFLNLQNLITVKKFINDHNLFTLSFLLYNFQYKPPAWLKDEKDSHIRKVSSSKNATVSDPSKYAVSLNYNKSLVITNSLDTSAKLNDSSKKSHSFKIITQEVRDDSSLNRIKVLEGNPLFPKQQDFSEIMRMIELDNDHMSPSYKFKDAFRILARAKYTNPEYNRIFSDIYHYFSYSKPFYWKEDRWFSIEDYRSFMEYARQLKKQVGSLKVSGARTIFEFTDRDVIYFLRTAHLKNAVFAFKSEGYLDQFTSVFGLISPYYAEKNNIKPISDSQYAYFKKLIENKDLTQEEWEREYHSFLLNPANHDHIVNVNGNRIIVVGIALSPDYLLPSHSWLNLIPNKEKEALIYMDEYGYQNVKNNSLSSWDEYYLSLAYPQAVKDYNIQADYEKQLKKFMNDFLSGEADEKTKDKSDSEFELRKVSDVKLNSLVYLRSNYVDNFYSSLNLISYVLLGFLCSIILFTAWSLIKKYISSSLNTFGVFVANGIFRWEIILTSMSFILIPALVGTVVGYFFGLAFQPFVFGLFSDIWYLSPIFNGFNVSKLLNYIFVTTFTLLPVSLIPAFFLMKQGVGNLMKESVLFKQKNFSKYLLSFVKKLSSLWKFRLSVIISTLNRALILSAAAIFLFLFSSFLFNNLGQFNHISNLEFKHKHYGFEMDLNTPTVQSGQYFLTSYRNLGNTFVNKIDDSKEVLMRDSSKNSWKKEKITFKKNGTSNNDGNIEGEIIAGGINNSIHPDDLASYLRDCKDQNADQIYKDLGIFNAEYPSRLFFKNAYNVYLLKSNLKKKSNGNDGKQTSNCVFNEKYEVAPFPMKNASSSLFNIFYSSKKDDAKNDNFVPETDTWNMKDFDLSDYVPVESELWNKNTESNGSSSAKTPKQPLKITKEESKEEDLFKPLAEYYKKHVPIISRGSNDSNSSSEGDSPEGKSWQFTTLKKTSTTSSGEDGDNSAKVVGDFRKMGDVWLPTLSRLFRDSANYWLFSYSDLGALKKDPIFFKNKVIMPILFDHDWMFNLFGKRMEINPWREFNDFFSKYSPELVAAIEANHINFIKSIIESRYGPFFVNRFMTKHRLASGSTTSHISGALYNGKRSWYINKKGNGKAANSEGSTTSTTTETKNIDEGLYFLDPGKIIFFYDKLTNIDESIAPDSTDSKNGSNVDQLKHLDRYVMFRPDFLYLFFAIMRDPEFLKPEKAPIKISFNYNIYSLDYEKQFEEDWEVTGNPDQDGGAKESNGSGNNGIPSKAGITASYKNMRSEDYLKIPKGDQTYTYLKGNFSGNDIGEVKIYGLKQDARGSYIRLNKGDKNINEKLYTEVEGSEENKKYPIIVNQYTARKLGLKIGSTVDFKVSNTYDRYVKQLNGQDHRKKVTFKVVDIFDSYYQNSFFISQKNANEIIGLNPEYGYNGMFTKKFLNSGELPIQFTHGVSGYSASGLYSKVTISNSSEEFKTFLASSNNDVGSNTSLNDTALVQPNNYEWYKKRFGLDESKFSDLDSISGALEKTFNNSFALTPTIISVNNMSVFNDFIFNTVSDLVLSIINLFISILSPLLLCALLVITTLIIEDLKNLLTILNLLGFSYLENSVTILLYLGLVLGFSTLLALPISSAFLSTYVDAIFKSISVFLPVYLRPDFAAYSFLMLLGIFGFAYVKSMRKIRSLYLPVAMKSLNE